MSPSSVRGAARVAVVGAETEPGKLLREALALRRVPGERVDLYGTTGGEAILTEYAGEARLIQPADPAEIAAHDVVFLCERGKLASDVVSRVESRNVVIDLVDGLPPGRNAALVHVPVNPDALEVGGFYRVAHPLTVLLSEVLVALDRAFGTREAVALVLRPAADWGDPGLDELRSQTMSLLNFTPITTETFGAQLAFNVLAPAENGAGQEGMETRIATECARLLGWSEPRLTVATWTVPVFHGHCLKLRVRLESDPSLEAVRQTLADSRFLTPGRGAATNPVGLSGEPRIELQGVNADGLGGFWVSAVAGEAGPRTAAYAVQLAERVIDL